MEDLSVLVGVVGLAVILIAGLWAALAYRNYSPPSPKPHTYGRPIVEPNPAKYQACLQNYDPPVSECFSKMLQKRSEVINKYLEYVPSDSIETIDLNDHECVIRINDSFVVYFGICVNNDKDFYSERERIESRRPLEIGEGTACYFLKIEELTYNDIFKFDIQKLRTPFFQDGFFIGFRRFWGVDPMGALYSEAPIFEHIAKEYPQLGLKEWFENWEGVKCYFIVFKIDDQGRTAFCVKHTTAKDPKASARRFKKQIADGTITNIFDANEFLKMRATKTVEQLNAEVEFETIPKFLKNSDDLERFRGLLQKQLNTAHPATMTEAVTLCTELLKGYHK